MRKKYWSPKRISDEEVAALWKRRMSGTTTASIAKERGTTKENIQYLFKSRGLSLTISKKCPLPECAKDFQTKDPRQRFCCRKHMKLGFSREYRNATAIYQLCALPECDKSVWMTYTQGRKPTLGGKGGSGKRYCCSLHSVRQSKRRLNGTYTNIFGHGDRCEAPGCKEHVVLDEHHEKFDKMTLKSDKNSKTHWLCPTHHMKIHRNYAEFSNGKYVDLIPKILAGIKKKSKLFHNYLDTLQSPPDSERTDYTKRGRPPLPRRSTAK
jgi:hypothetical protein